MRRVGDSTAASDRPHGRLRLVLGLAQMLGAFLSFALLVTIGVSPLSLGAVVLTCVGTTVRMLLFGARTPRGRS